MFTKTRSKILFLTIPGVLFVFACQTLSGSVSTPTPLPPPPSPSPVPTIAPPTSAPVQPSPTQAPAEATQPASTSNALDITSLNWYLDSFDNWEVVGMITNNTGRDVDDVEVEVEAFDASGVSLYKETTYTDLYNIAAGESSPFSLNIFEDLSGVDAFTATIVGNSSADLDRVQVEISNSRMLIDDDGDVHVTGLLLNNSEQPIGIGGVSVATFDAQGKMLTAGSYNVSIRYLAPGEDGPFRVTMNSPQSGVEINDYKIYIDSEYTDLIDPFDLLISDAYNYTDAFGSVHLVGEVTNQGNTNLNIRLVAGIFDGEDNVLDASSVDLPISSLAPGETAPFDFSFWGPLNFQAGLIDKADTYSVQVDGYWTWETDTQLVTISTADDSSDYDNYGGTFKGKVVNDSGDKLTSATVVVYLTDKQTGEVVATGYDYVFDELAAGASTDYSVYVDLPEGFDPASVDVHYIVKGDLP